MSEYCYFTPLCVWEDNEYFIVSLVCDPQNKARPLGKFPKSDPNSRIHAMLFKQVLFKYKSENRLSKQ